MTARPDWKELSEATGLRVLTFPDGETLSAYHITSVRVAEVEVGMMNMWPRRVLIGLADGAVRCIVDDVEAVFALATEAHRRASMPVSPVFVAVSELGVGDSFINNGRTRTVLDRSATEFGETIHLSLLLDGGETKELWLGLDSSTHPRVQVVQP
jgi:hypothetical protein